MRAEALGKKAGFVGADEVQGVVGGMDFGEESKMTGDGIRHALMGSGHENKLAPAFFFIVEESKDVLPIGKGGGIWKEMAGEEFFEAGAWGEQVKGKKKSGSGAGGEEEDGGFDHGIRPDERAVQVDAEGKGRVVERGCHGGMIWAKQRERLGLCQV